MCVGLLLIMLIGCCNFRSTSMSLIAVERVTSTCEECVVIVQPCRRIPQTSSRARQSAHDSTIAMHCLQACRNLAWTSSRVHKIPSLMRHRTGSTRPHHISPSRPTPAADAFPSYIRGCNVGQRSPRKSINLLTSRSSSATT